MATVKKVTRHNMEMISDYKDELGNDEPVSAERQPVLKEMLKKAKRILAVYLSTSRRQKKV